MQQIIETIIKSGCSVIIDSVEDGRFCGSIKEKDASSFFLFGYAKSVGRDKGVLYPTIEQYAKAMPGLINWGASDVAILDGVAYAISLTGKKPFADFITT